MADVLYPPPPVPPPYCKPALAKPDSLPPYSINLNTLATQGFVILPIEHLASDPLYSPFSQLFSSSSQFFDLPEGVKSKYHIVTRNTGQASEEGYSNIPGEKCMITLRKAATTPSEFKLKEHAGDAWRTSGELMRAVLKAIEESLEMQPDVLQRLAGPSNDMPSEGEGSVATLLRMFRYERPVRRSPSDPPPESKVVAEPHKDLGLLSLVVGHTPGLECWDSDANCWVSCESGRPGMMTATLLVGQTLAKFTNWRYTAGRHRVSVQPLAPYTLSSPSDSSDISPAAVGSSLTSSSYRFSLVHALRAHLPLRVSSSDFVTPITGAYSPSLEFTDASIADIYKAISEAHWNVNIGIAERRKQEQALQEKVKGMTAMMGEANMTMNVTSHHRQT